MTIVPESTRHADRGVSGLWMAVLMAPEVGEELGKLGLEDQLERYFPARSAPMGVVPPEVVVATFFNFSPRAVAQSIPQVWEKVTPQQVLDAQLAGIDRALQRAFEPLDDGVIEEAAGLLRPVAETAAARPEGRPLFAGYAALPWPESPHLVLWHAHYLMREFRGDGHIAVLLSEGLTGCDALAIHLAQMPMLTTLFRTSRAWTDEEFAATLDSLRSRGWLTNDEAPTLTAEGEKRRVDIEHRTDELEVPAYLPIGQEGADRLIELGTPIGAALTDAGLALTLPN